MRREDKTTTVILVFAGVIIATLGYVVESTVIKIILYVLGGGAIILGILFAVACISEKKEKVKRQEAIADAFVKHLSSPEGKSSLEEGLRRRKMLSDRQRPQDDDYGYSQYNPIIESTVIRSYNYLSRLRTEDGKEIKWKRLGSRSLKDEEIGNYVVDMYEIFVEGEYYNTIYICPYGIPGDYAPKGFVLADVN